MNRQQMKDLGDLLKKHIPQETGFVIITFPVTQTPGVGVWNYISNCKRASMIEGLEAILEKWKHESDSNN